MTFVPYRTTYSRYLCSLRLNGFYTRYLDDDDFRFLERIHHAGSIGGNSIGDLQASHSWGGYANEARNADAYALWESASDEPTYFDLDATAALEERAWSQRQKAVRVASLAHQKIIRDELAEAMAKRRLARAEAREKRQAEFERQWLQRQADAKIEAEVLAQEFRAWEIAQERIAEERAERLRKTALADLEWEAAEKKRTLGLSMRQRHELDEAERALELAAMSVRKLNKKVRHHGYREEHRGHPREVTGNLETG